MEVLYNVAGGVILSLGSSTVNQIGLFLGVTDELHKLTRTVSTIQAVLIHAEEQSNHNPAVKNWLGLLSEALYDAEDLLDEFSYEALHQQAIGGSELAKKVRLFFSSSNQFAFRFKMGRKVRELRLRLDEIAAEKIKFHLEERTGDVRSFVSEGRNQTHSTPPQVVIGREHDKEEIVRLLLSSDCNENVSVVSVVGIGGLGKTTLAQIVYNDYRVSNHFELKIWVCVSDEFDVKLLVKKLLESVTKKAPEANEMEPLKETLYKKISGRRYLLVFDDVWNEDLQKWYNVRELLACGARGSRVVVTTRSRTVAEMSRPIFIHELRGLPDNEAWSLFKQMAFKQQQPPNPNLEALGKEIVPKCCGVPLAIKTIGGMLYFKDSESSWLSFKDKELSAIDVYKNGILPILKLSYDHLPSHYKQCFAYCSLFPKDFRIHVEELIQLWKAQGYLKSRNSDACLRDVGFEYFMDLFHLSFFQDLEMDRFGNIEYCRMHDLMHDLAISVAGENFCASHLGTVLQRKTHHLSFQHHKNSLSQQMSSLVKARKIRTVLALDDWARVDDWADVLFYKLRCLRVLNLHGVRISKLPNSLYNLKHLRYLDLSYNDQIKKLPNSVSDLQNMQVLNLKGCHNLKQLPSNITKLVNLTDLENYSCGSLSRMPRGIGKLTGLEKLSKFVVDRDNCIFKNSGGLDELHSLNNLRGELQIKNLRYVKNALREYEAAHLSAKEQLQGLSLHWGWYEDNNNNHWSANDVTNEEMGMEALSPHTNLKALQVCYYRGVKPPSWLPLLTNLMSVSFEFCRSIRWLPPFDKLPHLKELRICALTMLELMDVEYEGGSFSFFPSLTNLSLIACPNLKGFERQSSLTTEELPYFPCLSHLDIRGCPNLTRLSLFSELENLKLDGDGMKLLMETQNSASESAPSPFFVLSQLKDLQIWGMEDSLENKFLQYLPSLRHIVFLGCAFRSVCSDDEKDNGMHWQSLKVLGSIEFIEMKNLVALPKGLEHVTTLQSLYIKGCPSLVSIPEWMPKLTALQRLSINDSPQLEERCKNNSAEDWPKISHIPNILINTEILIGFGAYLSDWVSVCALDL